MLPDTVTGAVEMGVGLTLIFAALTAHQSSTAIIVVALGLATTAAMCHTNRERRGVTRTAGRTAAVWGAAAAALAVLIGTLSVDLPAGTALLISPVVLALAEFGLRWLAERQPALTAWHIVCWLLTAATCLTPALVPASQVVLVAGLVCGVSLAVMGAVDIRRLTEAIGATPEGPKPPPNPVWEWVRDKVKR
jgi:hypothetical protein